MPDDFAVIAEIERIIGKKLRELHINDLEKYGNGFALDDGGRVMGLNLKDCKLTDISALQSLTQLITLELSNNQLTDVSALRSLTQLTKLYLHLNQLTDISALQSLTQLAELWLYRNQLTDISALKSLTQLKKVDLGNNKITRLPTFIAQWDMEIKWERGYFNEGLNVYDNPLETPPVEIAQQGMRAMRNYFAELEYAAVLLLQAKLLFVGSGEVGKTTLMRTLTEPGFQLKKDDIGKEETTHGIQIKPWSLTCPLEADTEPTRELTLHTWDFGGQEIYLSTHQFFLTKRSLYIFVWEARKEEEFHSFGYWLNVVKLLSDDSPVIVVMNKADVRGKPIDEAAYADKFKNIAAFLQVSCLTGAGMDELNGILREVLGRMPHLKDTLPKAWQDIRKKLEAEQKDYIDAVRYYEICGDFGLDRVRADHLSDYLHDLGATLCFRADPLLKNTLVLNPEWATEAVYKLIDTKTILDNKGRFDFNDLETIWDPVKYPVDRHPQLIRLMEKFELCFNLTGTSTYIVPELVPGRRPAIEALYDGAEGMLRFRYAYDFMPRGIVSRFIARNYLLIRGENFWRNGVELCFEESTALVTGDPLRRGLQVAVLGPQQTELLAIIRNELNHIHDALNMKKDRGHYKEEVPCNCNECLPMETPFLFPVERLKKAAAKGVDIQCGESFRNIVPRRLLQGYAPPVRKATLLAEMLRVVQPFQAKAGDQKKEENSRTGFIAKLLEMRNFIVHEQMPMGRSQAGKRMGLPDLVIAETNGQTAAVVEAFNLSGLNRTVIFEHLSKIFSYDIHGLRENFILVYVNTAYFAALWSKYTNYIKKLEYTYPLTGDLEAVDTGKTDIKCVCTVHDRNDEETRLYHLFINMGEAHGARSVEHGEKQPR